MIRSEQIRRPQLVLVVDDYEINRDVLGIILEDEYEVIYAENGKEALEMMRANIDRLSIVLLDLMMPEMDGFEVLETVRQDEQLSAIPIIVLTAEKDAELRALQMGAADFITKPFDISEVIMARVRRIIELSDGRQLISTAEIDSLTGLYSTNFFYEYANRIFQYHPELKMDAIALNIDKFHSINAMHGRSFGDEILHVLGEEIKAFVSEIDGIAGRENADRFVIYCTRQPDYAALLERFQNRVNLASRNARIQLRMGVMPWQEDMWPLAQFDGARTACGIVRGDYHNPIMIYDDAMREKELFNQRLLNELQHAIDEKQFQVFYQPKYDVRSHPPRLSSAEALVRWKHPELGMISPGLFIPFFEGNGMIGKIDSYVWQEAASQVARWRDRFGFTLPVSINLSRSDVFDPMLVRQLEQLIEKNGLQYKDIKLEITESAYTDNAKHVLAVIGRLRELGFKIEMDDFGSGYSSLNMLSDMPIDVLKMDMKFVRNIEQSETDRRLVMLILDIAKYLDVRVVAEGVETNGQLDILRSGNCDLVQGYYFSRPLPAEEFEKLIEKSLSEERSREA